MKYLMMIYRDDAALAALSQEALQTMRAQYNQLTAEMCEAGVHRVRDIKVIECWILFFSP
jgi:hypothetical protein